MFIGEPIGWLSTAGDFSSVKHFGTARDSYRASCPNIGGLDLVWNVIRPRRKTVGNRLRHLRSTG